MADATLLADLLETMFDANLMSVCAFDERGLVLSVNGAAAAWSPPPGNSIYDSALFVGLNDAIADARRNRKPFSLAGLSLTGDATAIDIDIVWLEAQNCFAALSKSATERVSLHQSAAQAVRDNRLLEETIREQREMIAEQADMLRLFVRHVPAAVAMLDEHLNVLMTSDRWIADHGDPRQAPSGALTASPLSWPHVREALRMEVEGGVPTSRVVKSDRGGRPNWKRVAQAPWRRANHEIGGAILFSEDVTDAMRKAESLRASVEDLHRLDQEFDRLGEAVANDLRTPMRQIDFFSRFLIDSDRGHLDATTRDYLSQIRACAERIDRMMAALQAYLQLSHHQLLLSTFNLSDAVSAAANALRMDLERSHVTVTVRNSATIHGDLQLVSRLFEKLIDNSIKYAGPATSILIDCIEEADGLSIQMTDDGPGIAPHLRRRALDFFERLDAPMTIAGDGMGLAECRKIADLHGGGLTLDPDFDGGLRVLINLPPHGPASQSGRSR